MKRILSLALALVMILSVMPMASAAENDNPIQWNWTPDGHTHTPVAGQATQPTCGTAGSVSYTCSSKWGGQSGNAWDCYATGTQVIDATGEHTGGTATCKDQAVCTVCNQPYGEKLTTHTGGTATCKDQAVCTVCNQPYGEKLTTHTGGTATCKDQAVCTVCNQPYGEKLTTHTDADNNGVCDVCTAQTTTFTLVVDDTSLEIQKGNTASISARVTRTPDTSTATLPTITYGGGESSVATIDATGKITAVGVGSTSFTVSAAGCTDVTVTVDVYNSGVISCDNVSTTAASVILAPTLTVNGAPVSSVTYSFKIGSTVLGTGSSVQVSGDKEIKTVTVSVVKYTIGSTEYNNAGEYAIADKTVMVSFYDVVDVKATVKSGVTTFGFADTKVFSATNAPDYALKPENASLNGLMYNTSSADWFYINMKQETSATDVISITYPGSNQSFNGWKPSLVNEYTYADLANLKVSCVGKGTFVLNYELLGSGNLVVQSGSVTLTVGDTAGDIVYKTTYDKAVTVSENDFTKLWTNSTKTGKVSYVMFDAAPEFGELYTDSTLKTKVYSTTKFYFSGTDNRLGKVTFVPEKALKSAYSVLIPFTIVGETSGQSLSGIMEVKIGSEMKFTDVKTSDYFYDAVVWAVGEGITSGLSETTFGPNATCTRAQVVTFLWRAAGKPAATGTVPFTDVKTSDYYYDAVVWAYKNNVTTGLTATTFGPNATVTRGQVVTFLARALNEKPTSSYNPFNDVKATDYFYDAVRWAVEDKVTTGLSATSFGPNSGCTRGQIVTFLYRAYEGE